MAGYSIPSAFDLAGFSDPQVNNYLQAKGGGFDLGSGMSGFSGQQPFGSTSGIFGGTLGGGTGGVGGGLFSMDGLKLAIGGLGTIGNLWNAFQAQKLARDTLNFQKEFANTNLANQIKSYNTALSDRAVARGFTQGDSDQSVQDYIKKNSLSR